MTGEIILWLVLFIVLVIAELATFQLVSVWFALGALGSLIAAACGASFWVQILIFVIISTLLLFLTRPILKKFVFKQPVPTNSELDIGKTAKVTESIDNIKLTGRVNLSGVSWAARSSDGKNTDEGETVVVDKIEGTKLYVSAE